jgi:hypothetical protein
MSTAIRVESPNPALTGLPFLVYASIGFFGIADLIPAVFYGLLGLGLAGIVVQMLRLPRIDAAPSTGARTLGG